uniref:Uncharacterized protein n=1 Tax=Arundo donax TaxID=35708 RepID=A0A0A9N3I9_ARUDO
MKECIVSSVTMPLRSTPMVHLRVVVLLCCGRKTSLQPTPLDITCPHLQ